MIIFSRSSDNLINNRYILIKNLGTHTRDIRGKKFGKLKPMFPVCDSLTKTKTIYWICLCDCGNYYRVLPGKLINGITNCCPVCNDGVVTNDHNIVHPLNIKARKTDEELVDIFADEFYNYFKDNIELEDFKQELYYIFTLNRSKGKSRTWCIQYYLRDLKCKLRNYHKKPVNYTFISYDNIEIHIDNIFDYLDIYPLDAKLNNYLNECLYLTQKEKQVLKYIYFNNLTIIQIGNIMNLSKQRISQIHLRALDKLRSKIILNWNKGED